MKPEPPPSDKYINKNENIGSIKPTSCETELTVFDIYNFLTANN